MTKKYFAVCLMVLILTFNINAQRAEVSVSLSEQFFDALLDSIYQNFDPPEFSMAEIRREHRPNPETVFGFHNASYALPLSENKPNVVQGVCRETVRILREMDGVRTAVRFREGRILVPLAFSGNYAPPFVGCVEFAGWAESVIDLEYDQAGQRLIGKARVLNVNLNGTGGVGGTLIARLIQGSIDKKLNPIEILRLDKVSFGVPIQNAGNIRMKALGVTPEVANGSLNIRIAYEFSK